MDTFDEADAEAIEILRRLYFETVSAFASLVLNNAMRHLMMHDVGRYIELETMT